MHLGAGMEGNGRKFELEEGKILDDEGVDTNVVELANHVLSLLELIVEEDGVDGCKYFGTKYMCIVDEFLYIENGVACSRAGTK